MSRVELLSSQDQEILLWVAEAETRLRAPTNIILADQAAFDRASTAINQLVERGLLGREAIESAEGGPHGFSVYLTAQGMEMVVELWRQRYLQEGAEGLLPAGPWLR